MKKLVILGLMSFLLTCCASKRSYIAIDVLNADLLQCEEEALQTKATFAITHNKCDEVFNECMHNKGYSKKQL